MLMLTPTHAFKGKDAMLAKSVSRERILAMHPGWSVHPGSVGDVSSLLQPAELEIILAKQVDPDDS